MLLLSTAPLALLLASPEAPPPDAAPDPVVETATPEPAPAPETESPKAESEATAPAASAPQDAGQDPEVETDPATNNPDPFEPINRVFYAISQPIDTFILRPVALAYKAVLPEPIRDGIHNALANMFTPTILANDILQLRPRRAGRTIARFVINSTLGLGGIFDMARRKPFRIAGHPNSLADTLGVAGAGPGLYFYLPVMGPSSFRDLVGLIGDAFTQPLLLDKVTRREVTVVNKRRRSFVSSTFSVSTQGLATLVLGGVDARARADEELRALKRQSVDPYAALRASYLQNRAGEIAMLKAKDGAQAEVPAFDDPLADPEATPRKPAAKKPEPSPDAPATTGAP